MKKWALGLVCVAAISFLAACGGGDTNNDPQTDGDSSENVADGDSNENVADGDVDVDPGDPFSGLDCTVKTPLCNLWYCNAKKTYDDLYGTCEGAHDGFTQQDCDALKVCADSYKTCIAPYRAQCVGDSVPTSLITDCTSKLSACQKPYLD